MDSLKIIIQIMPTTTSSYRELRTRCTNDLVMFFPQRDGPPKDYWYGDCSSLKATNLAGTCFN